MGQVQSAETATDGDATEAAAPVTTAGAEDASGTGEPSDQETALGLPPVPFRRHTDRSPLGAAAPSKSAIRPPVEQGDIAAKRERSTHHDARRVKREEETPSPAATTHTTNELRGQRVGRPRSRRLRHERGADRPPTPAALPRDVAVEVEGSWSSEPEISSAPRAAILAAGLSMRRVACGAVVTCCFAAVVAALTYGTIKSIGHHARIVEEFGNWTIARVARSTAATANATTATTAYSVDTAEASVSLAVSDVSPISE